MIKGILFKQSGFVHLVFFAGLYLICLALYYILILDGLLPVWLHISVEELRQGPSGDAHTLQALRIAQLLYSVFCFLLPAAALGYLAEKQPFKAVGLCKKITLLSTLLAVLILVISLPMVGLLAEWNRQIHFPGDMDAAIRALQKQAEAMTKAFLKMPGGASLAFNLIMIGLIPAVAEEWFFRGALQRLLIRLTGRAWAGICIAAVIFSLLHGEMLGFFPRVLLGAILGLIYYFSGSLWLAILAHFFNNGMQVVLFYLFQHHYIAYDVSKEQHASLWAGLVSMGLVVALFYYFNGIHRRKSIIQES